MARKLELAQAFDTDEGHFFEGAEKLLEIWFGVEAENADDSLRHIPVDELVKMLDLAHCHILHRRSNGHMDSYVLSESSMFVSKDRIILKTCGTTHLLETVGRILELASKYANMITITNVYYSRKNFFRPELQPEMHMTFDDEVAHLDRHFEGGVAFCMGPLKNDQWFLYANAVSLSPTRPDQTLELQMTELPADVLNVYSRAECRDGQECRRRGNIDKLMPNGTLIHEELFEPVGYSMNGLIPDSDEYVSIHITPEPASSYVSFETNHSRGCPYTQALKVIDCFRPNKFIVTLFSNELSTMGKRAQQKFWHTGVPGYRRISLQLLRLQYDTLVFALFVKQLTISSDAAKNVSDEESLMLCSDLDPVEEDSDTSAEENYGDGSTA